jgi:hypothetical protein
MPADDGLRLTHDERRTPARPDVRQANPEESVASAQVWSWPLSAQDGQLLAEGQVFQGELAAWQEE